MIIDANSHGSSTEGALVVIPAALSSRPNPLSLLKALERRWPLALLVAAVLGIAAAAAGWFFLPPGKYTAPTLLAVPTPRPFMFGTREPVLNLQDHQRNQLAMVRSRLVILAALKQPDISRLPLIQNEADPVEWLERELQADFSVAPEVMRLAISGNAPDELTPLVTAVRKAYWEEILDKEKVERTSRLALIGQLRKYETQLRTQKEEQSKLVGKIGGRDPGLRGQVLAFMYLQLDSRQRDLIQIQSELRRAKADLGVSQASENGLTSAPVPDSLLDDHLNREPLVQEARANLQRFQGQLEATLKVAKQGEQDPSVRQIRQQISNAEAALADLRKKLSPAAADELRIRHDLGRSIQQLKARIAVLEEEDQVLQQQLEKIRRDIVERSEKSGSRADTEFESVTHLAKIASEFQREEESLKIEMNAPVRHRILEDGVVIKPRETQRVLMASGGAGLGTFGLVLVVFALIEFRARRVKSPDELTTGLGLPIVGAIPDIRYYGANAAAENEQSFLNEAVDTIRTMLLRADRRDPLRVLLVTSAQSGEGKTSLSTRLSTSLAQIGYRTLLIDGDLRHPIVHKMFNMDRGRGFCDLLRGEATIEDVIRCTDVNQLSLLSAGRWCGGATRALAQDGARQLIETFRSRFDFVIIDSSPVLPVVDPLLLGQYADGAILSVLRDVSRMPNIYAAYQRLTAGGVRVLGAVMSGVRGDPYRTYYPYGELTEQPAA